jgi:hypothetical protein
MVVEHANTLSSQTIDVGRLDFGAVAADIRESLPPSIKVSKLFVTTRQGNISYQIIGKDEEEIGTFCGHRGNCD